jgi:hypothetical protein
MIRFVPFRRSRRVPSFELRLQARKPFRILLLVLTGLCLVVVGLSGCGLFPYSTPSGPPPELSVVKVSDLGPIPTNRDILGRDGGYSALFQGHSVWLYGDTLLIAASTNRRPTAAMLLLDHLCKANCSRDGSEIENLRNEIQHNTSTGHPYEVVTLEGDPPVDREHAVGDQRTSLDV